MLTLPMYKTGMAYFLWLISGFGALGFHRFYLGKIPTGLLWMFTGGFFALGSIYDFLTLPGQVREANIRDAIFSRNQHDIGGNNWRYASDAEVRIIDGKKTRKEKPEQGILKLARKNKGILTISEVALELEIELDEAKKYLDNLVSKGFADIRIRKNGAIVYVITDMVNMDEGFEDI